MEICFKEELKLKHCICPNTDKTKNILLNNHYTEKTLCRFLFACGNQDWILETGSLNFMVQENSSNPAIINQRPAPCPYGMM